MKIIYIHPETPMTYPRNIPISFPALIKKIGRPVTGYCATRVKDAEIAESDIILLDIHWFFSLQGAKKLIDRIRRIKGQSAILIAGGMTATEYPKQLVDKLDIDYVIRGDGEGPLIQLINVLVDGGDLKSVPNLIGKNGLNNLYSVKPYSLNKADFDSNEFYDIDFFPFLKQELMGLHARNPGMPPFIYPFLMPFRGCPINCDFCAGAPEEQKKLFGRRVVVRSPEKMASDLDYLERQDWIRFCNCLLDFVTLLPEKYAETALANPSRLKIQYEFTKAPTTDALSFFLSRFTGGTIHFSTDDMHLTSERYTDPAILVKLIKMVQKDKRYVPILDFSSVYSKTNVEYRETIKEVIKKTGCLIYDGSIWWSDFPKPDKNGFADQGTFDFYMNNAVTTKHYIANTLNRVINTMDLILPDKILIAMRKAYYTTYHKYPFLLNG